MSKGKINQEFYWERRAVSAEGRVKKLEESLTIRDKEIVELRTTLSGAYRKNYTGYRCPHTDERLWTLEKIKDE